MILDDSIDILLMTETWLYAQGNKACIDEMMLRGYVLQSFPWTGLRGGGIAFIVQDAFCDSTSFKPLSFQSFKAIQLHISGRNLSILVVDYAISGISHVDTNSSHPNQFKRCFLWVDSSALIQIIIPLLFSSTAVLPRKNLASCPTNLVPAVSQRTPALPLQEHRSLAWKQTCSCVTKNTCTSPSGASIFSLKTNMHVYKISRDMCLHIDRYASLYTHNRWSSEIQGTALSKCPQVLRGVGTLSLGVQWESAANGVSRSVSLTGNRKSHTLCMLSSGLPWDMTPRPLI